MAPRWTDAELLAACDALKGLWLTPGMDLGQQLSLSLHDAQALEGTAARWGVGDGWLDRVQQVAGRYVYPLVTTD